jgi:hypothetical protein
MAIVTAQPPLFAQEEATFFGRRIGGDNSGTRTSSSRENHVFYNTVWSFFCHSKYEETGRLEFRADGNCSLKGVDGEWIHEWHVVNSRTVKIGDEEGERFTLSDDGKTGVHSWHGGKFRVFHRGTRLPPSAPHVVKTIAKPGVVWKNLEEDSQYEFTADGNWTRVERGNKEHGIWVQTVGNTIQIVSGTQFYFEVPIDGKFIIRHDQKKWHGNDRTSSGSISPMEPKKSEPAGKTTATQAIATELSALNKYRDEALSSALTQLSKSDERQLEYLKRRAISGQVRLAFFKEIQTAIEAVKQNKSFDAFPLKFRNKPSSVEQEFCKLKEKRDNGIFTIYKVVEARCKRAYENLRKRALLNNDIPLAQKIQEEMDSLFPAEVYVITNLWKAAWREKDEVIEFKRNGEIFSYKEKTGWKRWDDRWEFRRENGKVGIRWTVNGINHHWLSTDKNTMVNPVDGGLLLRVKRN